MEITWRGNTCFLFKGKNADLVVNPDKEAGELKADVVLSSLKSGLKVPEGTGKFFDWPGEYEIKGIPITGFQAWTKSKSKEEEEGGKGDSTILFYFEIDGIRCCHLGELGHVLTSDMANKMGDVDILIIKAGEDSNLSIKKAIEVVESIAPRALMITETENSKELLKELGIGNIEPQEKFVIKARTELPEDKRAYIVLKRS